MIDPYHVEEGEHNWSVLLNARTIANFNTEEHANAICAALNGAFREGYTMGYEVGSEAGIRLSISR